MNQKTAAICILFFVIVATALSVAALNPAPSTPQRGNFSGGASNSAGESVGFNVTATQAWQSEWGQGSWYVGGIVRTKTHYAQSIVMGGQHLQNGTAHWKIQFRGEKGAAQSVRWTSEATNKYFGPTYTDSYDEQISTLATALSFATANNSVNTVAFKIYIEIWVTGAITGQQLYAHTPSWTNLSSNPSANQITYVAVSEFTTWVKPTAQTWEIGSGPTGVTPIQLDDEVTSYALSADAIMAYVARGKFTFNIPSTATEIRAQIQYKPNSKPFMENDPVSGGLANDIMFTYTGGGVAHVFEFGSRSVGTWYTDTTNWVSAAGYRFGDGSVYVSFQWQNLYSGGSGGGCYIDYVWLQYKVPASWFDSPGVSLLTLVAVLSVIGVVWWRRRR